MFIRKFNPFAKAQKEYKYLFFNNLNKKIIYIYDILYECHKDKYVEVRDFLKFFYLNQNKECLKS